MKEFKKLAFFDFDGTLTDGAEFVYTEVWRAAGIDPDGWRVPYKQYLAGTLSYEDWVKQDVVLLQNAGMNKASILDSMRSIHPMIGARETIAELKKRNYGIIVVSGGINLVLEKVYPDFAELFDHVFINRYLFDAKGNLNGSESTPYDFKDKDKCIQDMAKKYQVPLSQTIFTGDNLNDIHAAQVAGISFAFNTTHEGLIKIATHHIKKKDLREILPYLDSIDAQ